VSGRPPLIGVSGQIAAGKSTLVRRLATELGLQPLVEREQENPYLERYYRDPSRWAFPNVLFFFEQSLTDQVQAQGHLAGVVQERLPEEHIAVFAREFHARGFLSDDDIALFERVREVTSPLRRPPDLLIYLEVDPQTALWRLKERGWAAEAGVTLDYLEALGTRYKHFIDAWSTCPVLRVNSVELDIRANRDAREVVDRVVQQLRATEAQPLAG
jgi:deoxyadenosine/deoxycytidine kinase